ncbi:MAG: DUF3048 domain-containing protein [Oscillospiraceae bacterium]
MKKIIPIILAAVMLMLTACGNNTLPPPDGSPVPPDVKVTPSPTPTPEPIRNPLSGEITDKDISSQRPYAVMINNISVAQPLCGISGADILYEVLAEGEITRMMPIFTDISKAGAAIGSMRSSRPYYIELAQSYDAIYVHAGGSDQAYADIASKGINNIDGVRGNSAAAAAFYRDKTRQKYGTEHSLFTSPERVLEATDKLAYPKEHSSGSFNYGLSFVEAPDMSAGTAAATVNVSFGGLKNTDFTYHSDTGMYTGFQHKSDLIDGNTGKAVEFKNLLVLYAETKILDDYGRRGVNLNGSGTGHFICNGKTVPITWSHSGTGAAFSYSLSNGQPLELSVGKSYIAVVPTESVITIQ